jgi:hypothetical protein
MTPQVPALREALQTAADRRYGRRRLLVWPRRVALALALVTSTWVALTAAAGLTPFPPPSAETTASPTPTVYTTNVQPLPSSNTPNGPARFVEPVLLDERAAEAAYAADAAARGTLVRAWLTPGMQGERAHVFLYRGGTDWCLSVADPSTDQAGDRGVGCSTNKTFERFGVSVSVGSNYAAVVAHGRAAPTYRRANGRVRSLDVADGGLIAIARVPAESAVTLRGPDGSKRTDTFRAPIPMKRYSCSNGTALDMPVTEEPPTDPCATLAPTSGVRPAPSRSN